MKIIGILVMVSFLLMSCAHGIDFYSRRPQRVTEDMIPDDQGAYRMGTPDYDAEQVKVKKQQGDIGTFLWWVLIPVYVATRPEFWVIVMMVFAGSL